MSEGLGFDSRRRFEVGIGMIGKVHPCVCTNSICYTHHMLNRKRIAILALFMIFTQIGVQANAASSSTIKILSVGVAGQLVQVKWSAPKLPSKSYFEIEYSSKIPTPVLKVVRSTSTSISTSLNPYTTYQVRIRSKGIAGGTWSSSKSFTTSGNPVSKIAIVNTTHTTVQISWEESPGASSYEVTLDKGIPQMTNQTSFTFSGLKPGFVGSFFIRPISGIKKGVQSPPIEISSLNSGPTSLTASLITTNSFLLSWPGVFGASSYNIYKDSVKVGSSTITSYTVNALSPGSSGSYEVKAVFIADVTESSESVKVSTLNAGPSKLTSSLITTTSFLLTWTAVVGADSYNVYKDAVKLLNTAGLTYSGIGLLPGSTAKYEVRAVFLEDSTAPSEPLSVTTLLDVPLLPVISNLSALAVTATWKLDPNVTSYTVTLYDSLGTNAVLTRSIDPSITSTVFTALTPLTNYTVGVINNYGKSSSKQSPLATLMTLKPTVTGVVTTNITTSAVTITWNALSPAATYEVFKDGVSFVTGLTITTFSYTISSLAPGNTYKLGVRATYLDGAKVSNATELSELSVTLLTDPTYKPVISTSPSITLPYASVPIVGAAILTSAGVWTSVPAITATTYQWQRSLDSASTWNDLLGATSASYTVTSSDHGFLLRSKITTTNLNGIGIAYSAATSGVASIYNIQVPVIRGIIVVGQVLEASDGTWASPYATSLTYQWKRDGSSISAEISPTYTLVEADIGKTITVQVTGSTSLGSLAITSPGRGLVSILGNTVLPVISGPLRVGGTLAVTTGTWIGTPASNTYQWQSSADGILWDSISGATDSTYVLKVAEAGLYMRALAFGNKTSSSSVVYKITAVSVSTTAVPALNLTNSVAPAVTGSWTVGTTVTASVGTWSSSGTFTYQWQSSSDNSTWASIAGATESTYLLTSSESTKYVRVQVTNTTSSATGVAYSLPRSKVGGPYNTALPTISGTIRVGSTQTVSVGTWSNTPTAYTYTWQKSSDGISWIAIGGATAATYAPTFDVANLQIRVSLAAVNGTDTATVTTAIVQNFLAPEATAIPTVSGTATVGQTLTSTTGTWPSTSSGYAYQWQKSSDEGVTWTNISGATASTYVLVTADAGYRIRSQVSLTTNAGSSSAYSLPSGNIAP